MELTQKQIDVLGQNLRRKHIKIELLDFDLRVVDSIEGTVTNGSITANATNDVRRSGNLTIAIPINLNGHTLFDKLDGFVIHSGGKIWLDKYLKIYVGITDSSSRDENIVWYKLGVFLINNPTRNFSANEFTISFQCVDLMAKLTGKRQGQLTGQTTVIEQGHYEEDGQGNKTYVKTLLSDTLSTVISELGGFNKYIINPIPEAYKYLPYEIKAGVGSTVYDILKKLMDIIPTWQMYFDLDGVFIVDPIPSGEDAIVYNIDEEQYISDAANYSFENVKNQVVVYGRVNTLTYYTENTNEETNVEYSDNTLILKYGSLNTDNFTIGGTTFGFFTPDTFNTSAINKVQIYSAGTLILTSDLVKFENSTKSFGVETGTTNIDVGAIPPKEVCFLRIYDATLTDQEVVDINEPVIFEFMGKQAVSYDMIDENLESPFYVNKNLAEPNYYAGLADTTIGLNIGEGYTLTLNNTNALSSLANGTIITFKANYTNLYATGRDYTSVSINTKEGTQLLSELKLVQDSWLYENNVPYRPNVAVSKLTNDYTIWQIRYEELDLDNDGVIDVRHFVLLGRNPNVITSVLSGGEYDNIYADQLAYERCLYELYMSSNMNDNITLSVVPNYLIDVNCKIKYNTNNALPRSIVNEDYDEVQYFITKQITYPLGVDSTPQTISAVRIYDDGGLLG